MQRRYGYNPRLRELARELRKHMTPQEKHLWYDFLRSYPVRVYRQRIMDPYILDFYCRRAHLAIEADGKQHYTADGIAYDEKRTADLKKYGIHIIRFTNYDIDHNFDAVCKMIHTEIEKRID